MQTRSTKHPGKNILALILLAIMLFIIPSFLWAADDAGTILATIGSEKITMADFKQELNSLPPKYRQMTADPAIQKEFLDTLVTRNIIYQEGVRQKMPENPMVKKQVDAFRKKLVVAAILDQEVNRKIKDVSDAELKTYYDKNLKEFQQPRQVKARHILVKEQKQAEEVHRKLLKGEDFATLANEFSTCPSKAKGGDLGFFTRDRMVKEFSDVAFSLKPKEISPVVKTQFGYHIIVVDEIKEGRQQTFDEVKTKLGDKIRAERKNQYFNTYITELKKQIKVTTYPDLLDSKK
ncbi:MAG: peptidylprolyl isomerase [Pseudomonadota bacterium]|nr:peptidylprolyl isomerase [Pseudomonadota bacterium]